MAVSILHRRSVQASQALVQFTRLCHCSRRFRN